MNDFTRQELQIILLDMNFYALHKSLKVLNEAVSHVELRDKIQSMIDNYCDHEHKDYSKNDSFDVVFRHICIKCGEDFL